MSFLDLARVAAIHPEDHSVDLTIIATGTRIAGVQVVCDMISTNTGRTGLPAPATPPSGNVWDMTAQTARDLKAVIGFLRGGRPVVLGFLAPQISQMTFEDGREIVRFASDAYLSIDLEGNTEFYHPSGTFIRIGTTPEHEDLTGKNFDENWKIANNTATEVHFHMEVASGGTTNATIDVAPDGTGSYTANQALTITVPTLAVVGNMTVSENMTVSGNLTVGGNAMIDGNLVVGGTIQATGSISSGGTALTVP